jgi:hypothetical protein
LEFFFIKVIPSSVCPIFLIHPPNPIIIMAGANPPGSPNASQYLPLEHILQNSDRYIKTNLLQTREAIVRLVISQMVETPSQAVVDEFWKPNITSVVDANLPQMMEEAWKELPKILLEAIDEILGPEGKVVLTALMRNQYLCCKF